MTPTPEHNADLIYELRNPPVMSMVLHRSQIYTIMAERMEKAADLIDTIPTWQDISTCPVNVPVRIKVRGWDWYGSNETIAMNVDGVRWHSSAYGCGRDLPPNVVPYAWLPTAPTEGSDT